MTIDGQLYFDATRAHHWRSKWLKATVILIQNGNASTIGPGWRKANVYVKNNMTQRYLVFFTYKMTINYNPNYDAGQSHLLCAQEGKRPTNAQKPVWTDGELLPWMRSNAAGSTTGPGWWKNLILFMTQRNRVIEICNDDKFLIPLQCSVTASTLRLWWR